MTTSWRNDPVLSGRSIAIKTVVMMSVLQSVPRYGFTYIWTGVPFSKRAPLTSKHLAVFPLGWIWNDGTGVEVGGGVVVLAEEVGTTVEGGTAVDVVGTSDELGSAVEVATPEVEERTTLEATAVFSVQG